jgi:ribosomal protein S18 acetylase RimI-like enzyme
MPGPRTLTAADFDAVHAAFVEAFSDYVVKLTPSRKQLAEMLTRRGYVPELSVGIFEDELVAFTLNGVEGEVAYDSGTGVIPSHRRRGLSRQMLAFVEQRLRERGCTRYVLEVIDANTPAIELYRKDGFTEVRQLQCWSYEPRDSSVAFGEGALHPEWWDVEPSWQNSTASLRRAKDRHAILGNGDGYAVVFPATGDVPQLAVRPEARRRGLGRQLLDAAATLAGKPLRLINVDARDAGIEAFLTSSGARKTVRQLELMKALSSPRPSTEPLPGPSRPSSSPA